MNTNKYDNLHLKVSYPNIILSSNLFEKKTSFRPMLAKDLIKINIANSDILPNRLERIKNSRMFHYLALDNLSKLSLHLTLRSICNQYENNFYLDYGLISLSFLLVSRMANNGFQLLKWVNSNEFAKTLNILSMTDKILERVIIFLHDPSFKNYVKKVDWTFFDNIDDILAMRTNLIKIKDANQFLLKHSHYIGKLEKNQNKTFGLGKTASGELINPKFSIPRTFLLEICGPSINEASIEESALMMISAIAQIRLAAKELIPNIANNKILTNQFIEKLNLSKENRLNFSDLYPHYINAIITTAVDAKSVDAKNVLLKNNK